MLEKILQPPVPKFSAPGPVRKSANAGVLPGPCPVAFSGRRSSNQRGPKRQVLEPVLTHKHSKGVILSSSGNKRPKGTRIRHKKTAGRDNQRSKWIPLSTAPETLRIMSTPGFPGIPPVIGCPSATIPGRRVNHMSRRKPDPQNRPSFHFSLLQPV